jgi:hypothetical protein
MIRCLLSLNQAVDAVFTALLKARRGEIFVSQVPSVRIVDLARALIGDRGSGAPHRCGEMAFLHRSSRLPNPNGWLDFAVSDTTLRKSRGL